MADTAYKQMISTFIRSTRPQSFRGGKPPRYPQRTITSAVDAKSQHVGEDADLRWRPQSLPSTTRTERQKSRLDKLKTDPEPRTFSSFLTDNYSREHNYLRISVTERCNLRCLYCMPEEGVPLSPSNQILTTPEIVYLSSLFVRQGVDKIRLTGGEPTVRKDIVDLMQQIGKLRQNGLKELCLTTNGISLHRKLDAMVEAGLTGVNLSLDTLDPFQFTLMTRRNGHEAVMRSIRRILDMNKLGAGIKLKINCVVMRGINEREILPFVEMGKDNDLEVRFIEYMPFDGNKWSKQKMLSFQEMLAMIREKYPDVYKVQGHVNDTSKTYRVPDFQGRIGFITSMTHNFCGTCNRLRITSDGNLKVCLFGNNEVSLRDILRESNDGKPIDAEVMVAIQKLESDQRGSLSDGIRADDTSEQESRLLNVIGAAVKRKKAKHAGMGELENMKNRPMILIDDAAADNSTASFYPPALSTFSLMTNPPQSMYSRIPFQLLPHNLTPRTIPSRKYCSTASKRHLSTHSIRRIRGQGTHRRIPHRSKNEGQDATVEGQPQTSSVDRNSPTVPSLAPPSIFNHSRVSSSNLRKVQTLSHLRSDGTAHMVDISHKKFTNRSATATAVLYFSQESTMKALYSSSLKKGDALAVARIAAIQAAKRTSDLIPLAHPGLGLTGMTIDLQPFSDECALPVSPTRSSSPLPLSHHGGVKATATVSCYGQTGVEMEALSAATVAALTLYDMLKGVDKTMVIGAARVQSKRGGKSGDWEFDEEKQEIIKLDPSTSSLATTSSMTVEGGSLARESNQSFKPFEDGNESIESEKAISSEQHPVKPRASWNPLTDRSLYDAASGVRFRKVGDDDHMTRKPLAVRERWLRTEIDRYKAENQMLQDEHRRLKLSNIDQEEEINRRVARILKREYQQERISDSDLVSVGENSSHDLDLMKVSSPSSSVSQSIANDGPQDSMSSVNAGEETAIPSDSSKDVSTDMETISISIPPPQVETDATTQTATTKPHDTSPITATPSTPSPPIDTNIGTTIDINPQDETNTNTDTNNINDPLHPSSTVHFNRATRNQMSGNWNTRTDSMDFQARRIERYEEWMKER